MSALRSAILRRDALKLWADAEVKVELNPGTGKAHGQQARRFILAERLRLGLPRGPKLKLFQSRAGGSLQRVLKKFEERLLGLPVAGFAIMKKQSSDLFGLRLGHAN